MNCPNVRELYVGTAVTRPYISKTDLDNFLQSLPKLTKFGLKCEDLTM